MVWATLISIAMAQKEKAPAGGPLGRSPGRVQTRRGGRRDRGDDVYHASMNGNGKTPARSRI